MVFCFFLERTDIAPTDSKSSTFLCAYAGAYSDIEKRQVRQMQDFMYSVVGVMAAIVQIILNYSVMFHKAGNGKAEKAYRYLMLSIFAYYITDAGWGLFAGLKWTPALFADTTIYYIAMAAALVSWNIYIVNYLDKTGGFSVFFKNAGIVFFAFETLSLAVNLFYPCFFWFDETGAYVAGTIRHLALAIQMALFFMTCVITLVDALRAQGVLRKRNFAIFLFSVCMLCANFFQLLYPLLPIYAMGCLMGSCILHVYVIEDEREEYRNLLAAERDNAKAANNAKSVFLLNMSHDIRTPMNAILGFTRIARNHIDDKERVLESLEKTELSGATLLNLINEVLEMSRIEAGKIEIEEAPGDMRNVFAEISPMLTASAVSKSIDFHITCEKMQNRYVLYDAIHINRVLTNLISNAIKYTPEGGKVAVTAEQVDEATDGKAEYRFTVSDTGIGMSREFLGHLFEEFSREKSSTVSKTEGTGLGLSIAKRITDLMGGRIEVTSEQGKGSVFTLTLPLRVMTESEASAAFDLGADEAEEADGGDRALRLSGKKALLVEDNELNREIATDILEDMGIEVTSVEDGDIAVEAIEKMLRTGDVEQYFDFVLMDIQMPVMDGYTASRAIRVRLEPHDLHIPIIAMTANAFAEDKQKAFESGMDAHIAKPVAPEKIMDTLLTVNDYKAEYRARVGR